MRKTFLKFFAAFSVFAVLSSCTDYSADISDLKQEIDSLEARVAALEEKLNTEVAALNASIGTINSSLATINSDIAALEALGVSLKEADAANLATLRSEIAAAKKALADADAANKAEVVALIQKLEKELDTVEAKVAVVKAEKNAAGNYILTFKDGSTIEVAAADPNANNTGLVTIVDGKWAVIGADGKATVIDAEVHPDTQLSFKVDPETKELLYTLDGENYEPTGAYVADEDYYLVTDFEESENYVNVTIGGNIYTLPLYEEESTFVIKSGVTYFNSGEQKSFKLAVDVVSEFYVMSKPDGWKAVIADEKLVVTAPVAENQYAEKEGEVLLHGTTPEGKCKVAKLFVSVNRPDGFKVEIVYDHEFVDEETGETYVADGIYIYNDIVKEFHNEWLGTTSYSFQDFYFGFAPVESFLANPSGYIENQVNHYGDDISFMWYNMTWAFANAYIPEVELDPWTGEEIVNENPYTVDEDYVSLNDIYSSVAFEDMPEDGQWVIWWSLVDDQGAVLADQAQYVFYEPVYTNAEFVEATYNDIKFSYTMLGDVSYYVGKFKNDPSDWMTYVDLEEQLYYFQNYGSEMGIYHPCGSGEAWLSSFALDEYSEPSMLNPDTEYAVYFFPLTEGRDILSYTYEEDVKPYVYTFKTEPLVKGGSAKVTSTLNEERTTINSIVVDVNRSSDVETVWFNFFDAETLSSFTTDEEIIAELIASGYVLSSDSSQAQTESYPALSADTPRTFVALAVDSEGQYSEIYKAEYKTKSIPYSEDITVTLASVTFDADNARKATLVYDVKGATNVAVYASGLRGSSYTTETQLTNWMTRALTSGLAYYTFKTYPVVDGKVTVEYSNYTASNCYSTIFAYNVDANGAVKTLSVPQADNITPVE